MKLTKDNFFVYCSHYYDNPFCISQDEFNEDLSKCSSIKKSLTKYIKNGETNIRLMVNSIISFYNVFQHDAATQILKFKINDSEYNEYLNSILTYLSLPCLSDEINEKLLNEIKKTYQ